MNPVKNIVIMHNKLSVYDTLHDIMSSKYNCIYLKTVAGEFRKIPEDIHIDLFIIDLTDVPKADILYISDRLNSRPFDTQPIIYSGSYYSNSVFKSKLNKLHDLVFLTGSDTDIFNAEINAAFNKFGFDFQVDVSQAVSRPVKKNFGGSGNNSGSSVVKQGTGSQGSSNSSGQGFDINHSNGNQNNAGGILQAGAGINPYAALQGQQGQYAGQGLNGYPPGYIQAAQSSHTGTHVRIDKEDKPVILVLDDDVNILTTVAKYLRKDYNVISVRSTALAFMKIGVKKPDLILLDYMIPVCDGKQTLQMIRSQFETSKIPVIMLTSLTEKDRVLQCFELGISGYLVKPVSKDDLMQAVNSVFK